MAVLLGAIIPAPRAQPPTRHLAAAVAALLVAAAAPAAAPAASEVVRVVVRAATSHDAGAAVRGAGGDVRASVDGAGAVTADLPAGAVDEVAATGAQVVFDRPARLLSAGFGSDGPAAPHVAALQPGPWWGPQAGAGVGVALVDTGVADTPALAGRVVRGPDLSGDGDGLDRYGHGTFMAGLIAGPDTGAAPGAHVVSVKVAGASGETTLVTVLEGMDWAVDNAVAHDVGVMSLSFGVEPDGPFQADPLSWAVESAWAHGITVVAAAGNEGAAHVTSPGRDPWVLTVGATDTRSTATTADDAMPSWSGHQPGRHWSKPDVLAPGAGVVSLRAPGSTLDRAHPGARVGDDGFRGSGTSMSTALAAGAVAALLQRHPDATPDDLKAAVVVAADPMAGAPAGAFDLAGADAAEARPSWWQQLPAYGGDGKGRTGMPWTDEGWSAARWTAARWTAARWSAARWSAARWSAARWSAARWSAARWSAARWSAARWSAARWSAARWSAARWSANGWGDGDVT
jgi:serine protease AprX